MPDRAYLHHPAEPAILEHFELVVNTASMEEEMAAAA
jgi:hypothetical protein